MDLQTVFNLVVSVFCWFMCFIWKSNDWINTFIKLAFLVIAVCGTVLFLQGVGVILIN